MMRKNKLVISDNLKKAQENFNKAAERFSTHLIENGKHFSIRGKLRDGNIFIEEEGMEDTNLKDDEYILLWPEKKK